MYCVKVFRLLSGVYFYQPLVSLSRVYNLLSMYRKVGI